MNDPPVDESVAVVAVLLLARRWRRRRPGRWRRAVELVAVAYGLGLVAVTQLPVRAAFGDDRDLAPWFTVINPVPLLTVDIPSFTLNVLAFVPLGLLLPVLARDLGMGLRAVGVRALLLSGALELEQLVLTVTVDSRRSVDVDDLLANTAGAVLRALLVRLVVARRSAGRALLLEVTDGAGPG